jgi:large subunit ribosomal protein L9
MKIILLKDVPKVGKKYEIKNVADGHALNFMIPRGLAKPATADAVAKMEKEKGALHMNEKVQQDLLFKSLDILKTTTIVISGKANEKGHLFAGITADQVIKEIEKQTDIVLDPTYLQIDKPIKETGTRKIEVVVPGKKIDFLLDVRGE